jgi:hypothetical protein
MEWFCLAFCAFVLEDWRKACNGYSRAVSYDPE